MADYVSSDSGKRYGSGVVPITLNGGGSNRVIVAIAVGRAGGEGNSLTGMSIGAENAAIIDTATALGDGGYCIYGVGVFLDSQHPGSATTDINVTFSSSAEMAVVVHEFSGWLAQEADMAVVIKSAVAGLSTGTTYNNTVAGQAGHSAVGFILGGSSSTWKQAISLSSNLTVLDPEPAENITGYSHIATGYDNSIDSASEDYGFGFTLTEGGPSPAAAYHGVVVLTEAAAPTPAVTTTDTLQPGEEFTLTATNYASAPVSPATLTDSAGSTITVPVTISGSGPYTAVGTMPTLAEAVTAGTSLLFGDVTIELST